MASGLVSVVLPTFDRAYCLGATVEAVLAQTWGRLELIIVDDGSTDGAFTVVNIPR